MKRSDLVLLLPQLGFIVAMIGLVIGFGFAVSECKTLAQEYKAQEQSCQVACGSDVVQTCYRDRVICVGTSNVYVKTLPK